MQFNLTSALERLGRSITNEMRKLMNESKHIGGGTYDKLKPRTIAEKEKLDIKKLNVTKRMLRTGDFQNKAFESSASGNTLTVKISGDTHGRDIRSMKETVAKNTAKGKGGTLQKRKLAAALSGSHTYEELARWQLDTKRSKFFPESVEDINGMQSVKSGVKILEKEIHSQLKEELKKTIDSLNAKSRR